MATDLIAIAQHGGSGRARVTRLAAPQGQSDRDSRDDLMLTGPIAVVDDDASVRKSTKLLLESFGFEVLVFDSADGFLGFDRPGAVSCLIVDVQMPGTSGLQLQHTLTEKGNKIPVVFITAYENAASREQAMQAGAVAFLSKPFSEGPLLDAIRLALRRRHDRGGTS